MQKKFAFVLLIFLLAFPFRASAQAQIPLDTVNVQLWPEFDQPSMLVIYDITITENAPLPADFQLRIPMDANLIAVAYAQDGSLLNVPYQEPYQEGDWQIVALTVDTPTIYHFEYYAPLTREDSQRDYTYLWPGDYPVNTLRVQMKRPVDASDVTTDPKMTPVLPAGEGLNDIQWETNDLEVGQQLPVKVTYIKTSDRLSASGAPLQAGPVDESTPGRISLNNYLPYILGAAGIILILAGGLYFWQSGKDKSRPGRRRRSRAKSDNSEPIYCSQCGQRAQPGDRFCRTCGSRLHH